MKFPWKIGAALTALFITLSTLAFAPPKSDSIDHQGYHGENKTIESRYLKHIHALPKKGKGNNSTIADHFADDFYSKDQNNYKNIEKAIKKFEAGCDLILKNIRTDANVPLWQLKVNLCNYTWRKDFYFVVALQVRIYKLDKAKWTLGELKQWMHYMFWAGAEHIYICDHYRFSFERLDVKLKRYIDAGLVTYIAWNRIRNPMQAQTSCYQHIITRYGHSNIWQAAIDMDEYPFITGDQREGFWTQYLKKVSFAISELSLHNYLMLGHGDRTKNMTIERIKRMTPKPANELDKPIYRPTRVSAVLHHNKILHGRRMEVKNDEARLLHYWGSRVSDFGPDKPDLYNITIEYPAMAESFSNILRHSLVAFGEIDAFNCSTGP